MTLQWSENLSCLQIELCVMPGLTTCYPALSCGWDFHWWCPDKVWVHRAIMTRVNIGLTANWKQWQQWHLLRGRNMQTVTIKLVSEKPFLLFWIDAVMYKSRTLNMMIDFSRYHDERKDRDVIFDIPGDPNLREPGDFLHSDPPEPGLSARLHPLPLDSDQVLLLLPVPQHWGAQTELSIWSASDWSLWCVSPVRPWGKLGTQNVDL